MFKRVIWALMVMGLGASQSACSDVDGETRQTSPLNIPLQVIVKVVEADTPDPLHFSRAILCSDAGEQIGGLDKVPLDVGIGENIVFHPVKKCSDVLLTCGCQDQQDLGVPYSFIWTTVAQSLSPRKSPFHFTGKHPGVGLVPNASGNSTKDFSNPIIQTALLRFVEEPDATTASPHLQLRNDKDVEGFVWTFSLVVTDHEGDDSRTFFLTIDPCMKTGGSGSCP